MTFDRLSLPIPEELLAQSSLRTTTSSNENGSSSELFKLLDDYEYHSQRANDAVRQIRAILQSSNCSSNSLVNTSTNAITATNTRTEAIITGHQVDTIQKAFNRKPRSLARLDQNHILGTALDGTLAVWSVEDKRRIKEVTLRDGLVAECISVNQNSDRVLVVANSEKPNILLYNTSELTPQPIIINTNHSKPVKAIEWCDEDVFVTASDDHTIAICSLEMGSRVVVNAHTSGVTAVKRLHSHVISAGLDSRLNRVDLNTGRLVETKKCPSSRWSHLYHSTSFPHMLIASSQSTAEQFAVFDTRLSFRPQSRFGWSETANLSFYVKAGWQPSGPLIACGTQSPVDRVSGLMVFDVRQTAAPVRCVRTEEKRWLECLFVGEERFVANATDGSLSFVSL